MKFIARVAVNGAGIWLADRYISGVTLEGGFETIAIGALVLAILFAFVRPVLSFIATPIIWLTLGLFSIVILMFLLWVADAFLPQFTIDGLLALFLTSLLIGLLNAFF